MKVLYPTNPTTQYYGRNATYLNGGYGAFAVAPHADTQRFLYTVPANRRAVITSASIHIIRITAAAPLGYAVMYIPANIHSVTVYVAVAEINSNGVGDKGQDEIGGLVWLTAGDTAEIRTSDSSTGGTISYRGSFTLVEFDP